MKNPIYQCARALGIALMMAILCGTALYGCDSNKDAEPDENWLAILPLQLNFDPMGGTKEVDLLMTPDVNPADITFEVAPNGQDWCEVEHADQTLKVKVDITYYEESRSTVVYVRYNDILRQLSVSQGPAAAASESLIEVTGGTATSENSLESPTAEDRRLIYSYDGNHSTYYNSEFGAIGYPFDVRYTLKTPNRLDIIKYYPRAAGGSNVWGEYRQFKVWVTTTNNSEPVIVAEVNRAGTAPADATFMPIVMELETPVENVETVHFEITGAVNNRVSCSEVEFVRREGAPRYDYTNIFTDDICSALKPGITEQQIRKMPGEIYRQLATAMLTDTYNTEYRVAEFRPYQNPSVMAASNRIYHAYSLRDNPTGIFVERGDELYVLVEDTHDQPIGLIIQDLKVSFAGSRSFALNKGENRITAPMDGLIYISNLTNEAIPLILDTPQAQEQADAKTVKIHFILGKVQGYFDSSKHQAADWNKMITSARYHDIDVVGQRAHITWAVNHFREAGTDIRQVIDNYDRLVTLEQEFMGLVKYGKTFNNRMYFHLDYNGSSPYASANRTAYTRSYAEIFANEARFGARVWGPAHEVGHINQTHGLKWAGTTEVTNNIFSLYVQEQIDAPTRRLMTTEGAKVGDVSYNNVYEAARAAIVEANQPHCLQNASTEFIFKLVPFWQLKLYLVDALGKEDFYKDLFEYYRTRSTIASSLTHGEQQLEFVRQTCRIANLNLIEFFDKWGFLSEVDRDLNDYGTKRLSITAAQITVLRNEINAAGYPMPTHPADEIIRINDGNVSNYK